jgi:glutamyl-tRNA reductase
MSVVVVGVEHRQAPLALLERVTVPEDGLGKVLAALRARENLTEVVVLSTCLRTEIYAVADRFHEAVHQLEEVLAAAAGLEAEALEPHRSVRFDDDVALHLFAVAAGLESAVPGEPEVLGQVRRAWDRAREEHTAGPVLSGLFRHAVETGKRVRSETAIARGTLSFAHAACDLAAGRAGGLGGTRVLVVGAGEMGEGLVGALRRRPPSEAPAAVVVANRTPARARALAQNDERVSAVGLDALPAELARADVGFVAVAAEGPVLGPEALGEREPGRPLVLVDLGVPRTVDPGLRGRPGLELCDLDDLAAAVQEALEERRGEMDQALAIVEEEVGRFRETTRARVAAPVVAALRQRLEELRRTELARRRPPGVDEATWAAVEEASRAALAKLLHLPTVALKESAGTPRGERLVEALRALFDIGS